MFSGVMAHCKFGIISRLWLGASMCWGHSVSLTPALVNLSIYLFIDFFNNYLFIHSLLLIYNYVLFMNLFIYLINYCVFSNLFI